MNFWKDVPFDKRVQLFDMSHIMYIVTVLIVVGLFIWKLPKLREKLGVTEKIIVGISIVQLLVLYSWTIFEIDNFLEAGLPIHLCRASTFMGIYFLLTKDRRIFHALYYTSFFALVAIFYPVNVHPIYTHAIGWSYQISHIMIILVWILGVFVYDYKPNIKVMNRSFVWFVFIVLVVWAFNYLVGSGEYLYLRGDVNRPFLKSMSDFIYIPLLLLVAYILMWITTIPFIKKAPTQ